MTRDLPAEQLAADAALLPPSPADLERAGQALLEAAYATPPDLH